MNNITTIIPIGDISKEEVTLVKEALLSIKNQKDGVYPSKVLIVTSKKIKDLLDKGNLIDGLEGLDIKFITEHGTHTIQHQINVGVTHVDTDYFTYLEFDDKYTDYYFKHVDEHINAFSDVSLFLPLTADILLDGRFLKYGNAEGFSRDICETPGFLTHEALLKMPLFNSISGGVFKTQDFIDLGKLKENIKHTFIYEYFLRITNQDQKIMIIPKLGYIHLFDRPNSYTMVLNESGITQEELAFWFDSAKREFYFTKMDRAIEYAPTSK